jgi:hypothetical protein
MEESVWADSVKNEELHNVKLERSILHKIKRKTANCSSHLPYELPPKTRYKGKINKKRGRGRRRKQLLNDLMEKRRWWNLKDALNGTLRRTRFVRGYASVGRRTT